MLHQVTSGFQATAYTIPESTFNLIFRDTWQKSRTQILFLHHFFDSRKVDIS